MKVKNRMSLTAKSCEIYKPGKEWEMVPDFMTRGMIDHVAFSYVAPPVRVRDGFIYNLICLIETMYSPGNMCIV